MSGFDIVGDVHGRADELESLLSKLGYNLKSGDHPDGRKLIFVGDLIDKGPSQRRVVDMVRGFVEDGAARVIMGNHEFNAIMFATEDGKGGYLRPHTDANVEAHQGFLTEFQSDKGLYQETIDWFKTMPILLGEEDFNVIHACSHTPSLRVCARHTNGSWKLKPSAYTEYAKGAKNPVYKALEILLKGPEISLPKGAGFHDHTGVWRTNGRLKWWFNEGVEPPLPQEFVDVGAGKVPEFKGGDKAAAYAMKAEFSRAFSQPVFFGHYALRQKPALTSPKGACLDFSGQLTAYRHYEGEKTLYASNLVCVSNASALRIVPHEREQNDRPPTCDLRM